MGAVHTRPSGKSTQRRTVSMAVLVPVLLVALSMGVASTSHAKQRTQSTVYTQSKAEKPVERATAKSSLSTRQPSAKKSVAKTTTAKSLSAKSLSAKSPSARATTTVGSKQLVRISQPISRVTKVQRSRPSPRFATAKHSPKLLARTARQEPQRVAKVDTLSSDPWGRAIAIERARSEGCDNPEQNPVRRIILPDMFGGEDEKGDEVLGVATRLLGRPYRFGARGYAFDCSGFVAEVFERVGVELPHSARDLFGVGDRITRDELAPGDLVFFRTYRRGASHVGIYMGEDKFIHAASGIGVKISSLNEDYYAAHYLGARRVEL